MGSREIDKTSKEVKEPKEPKTPVSQEQASSSTGTGSVNPEWSGFQAYSSMPPHGFLASSPQAHPYMWGVQHLMPPYGTPPLPYVAMYPHGGIYAHPSIPPGSYPFSPFAMPSPSGIIDASTNNPSNMEVDGKTSGGKKKLPIKRSKGSLGSLNMITGKNNEPCKISGASADGVYSKSAESTSEASSAGSGSYSQNDSQVRSGCRQEAFQAEASQNSNASHGSHNGGPNAMVNQTLTVIPMPATGAPAVVPGPTTNLNIGMDYWGAASSPAVPAMHGKDERELKRQRRKQSNRESARRSRLRKQVECDELAQRADVLKEENANLRAGVSRIRREYEHLLAQNVSLKGRLGEEGQRCGHTEVVHNGQ